MYPDLPNSLFDFRCRVFGSIFPFRFFYDDMEGIFPMSLFARSYTRVTLSLDIVGRLDKGEFAGYHELGIIKHQIDLADDITIAPATKMGITCDSPEVPLDESNLCWKAASAVASAVGINEAVHITLAKRIPVKGGLAGGSANAATVMKLCSDLWETGLDKEELAAIGRRVGMDVPFYFIGGTAFDTESTGIIEQIPTGLTFDFVLAIPPFGVSTKDAYCGIDYSQINRWSERTAHLREALSADDCELIFSLMHNDFELSVFPKYPQLASVKSQLVKLGCRVAVMSGSGSTVIGIADDTEKAKWIASQMDVECLTASSLGTD